MSSRSSSVSSSNSNSIDEGAILEPAQATFVLATTASSTNAKEGVVTFFDSVGADQEDDRVVELAVNGEIIKTGKWIPSAEGLKEFEENSSSTGKNNKKKSGLWPVHFARCEKIIWTSNNNQEQEVQFLPNGNMILGGNKEYCLSAVAGPTREED